MPRPGFYNDNEYRAYPFIFKPAVSTPNRIPNSAIVDCGVIMGLDSEFDGTLHSVWLKTVKRIGGAFEFEFDTDAPGAANKPLVFTRPVTADEWLTEEAESEPYIKDDNSCAVEPVWSGFLVTGPLTELQELLPTDGTITLNLNYILEPARVQSLVKTYLRAISLGNLSRPQAKLECETPDGSTRHVVINKKCVTGNIRFLEGYNAQIRQRKVVNEISITAGRGLGTPFDGDICRTHGEIPFYENEQSPFFGGTVTTTFKSELGTELQLPVDPAVGDTYGIKSETETGTYTATYYIWNNFDWEKIIVEFETGVDFPTAMPGQVQRRSKFLSGGPACDELIASINGIQGPDVNIIGGTGVSITADPNNHIIYVDLSTTNIAGNC